MAEIDSLIKKIGLRRVLEELITSIKNSADRYRSCKDVDYLDKVVDNLSITLTEYESRYDDERETE